MMPYSFINKEWIVSPTARRVYRCSAALSVALFVGLVAAASEGGIPATARMLVLPGALAAGITLVGMQYFFFRFDTSHPVKQILWFCVMILPLVGPALYCFFVYSRSGVIQSGARD